MIFVTVGTHEQQFNRLVQMIDELKRDGVIQEEVLIQTGYSTYEPKYCEWQQWVPYPKMIENVDKARVIITHGVQLYYAPAGRKNADCRTTKSRI